MAVTGLPEPDSDHAINMARFAYQCVLRFATVTEELEAILGPGTSALSIRYESVFYCLCRNLGLVELTCSYLTPNTQGWHALGTGYWGRFTWPKKSISGENLHAMVVV